MCNTDIRKLLSESGVRQYELADMLGVTEWTFSRKMRKELSEDQKTKIIELIEERKREKSNE